MSFPAFRRRVFLVVIAALLCPLAPTFSAESTGMPSGLLGPGERSVLLDILYSWPGGFFGRAGLRYTYPGGVFVQALVAAGNGNWLFWTSYALTEPPPLSIAYNSGLAVFLEPAIGFAAALSDDMTLGGILGISAVLARVVMYDDWVVDYPEPTTRVVSTLSTSLRAEVAFSERLYLSLEAGVHVGTLFAVTIGGRPYVPWWIGGHASPGIRVTL